MRKPNFTSASSSLKPSARNIWACISLSYIRSEPPPTSTPLITIS